MIIALDGPAGAGKSTVARRLAEALGLPFLDTGAMYRGVTLVVLERGVDPEDARACGEVAGELTLDFDEQGALLIDGRPGEPHIRGEAVTREVSTVSAHRTVREAVVAAQREIASRSAGLVAEGRDTTTVVFPDAEHKFFLDASLDERARRRALEEGALERLAEIRLEIERRDRLDSSRALSPLRKSPDAVEIDTEGLGVEEVVAAILERIGVGRAGG